MSSKPPKAETYAVRSASDWLSTPSAPVSSGPDGKAEANLQASCGCCLGEKKQASVLVYGGPDQSILVKKAPAGADCKPDPRCASSSGEPHLRTYDGLAYDFHGVGEFVLSRTANFEVQARYQPVRGVGPAAVGTAVAANLNGDCLALYAGKPARLTIGGVEIVLDEHDEIQLAAGGSISRDSNYFRLTSPGGCVVEARVGVGRIDLRVGMPPESHGGGLFGDRNGGRDDDLRPGSGPALTQPVDFADLYGVFADAWRVTTETSLFDYAEGESVDTFADRALPKRQAGVSDLDAATRRKAETVCRKAGVRDAINLENCIYDVGFTEDESYAETAAEETAPRARLRVKEPAAPMSVSADGVTIEAPLEGIASYPAEIRISGPAVAKHQIRFAPAGSEPKASAGNPYSSLVLSGGDQMVKLLAPVRPGDYELRYIAKQGEWSILISKPFHSIAPKARIEAPDAGKAGAPLTVRVVGDVSPNTNITVVPAGSEDDLQREHVYLREGTDVTVKLRKLPAEPGDYEVRYVSKWNPRQVYARKPVRIQ